MKPLIVLIASFLVALFTMKLLGSNYDLYLSGRIAMCVMLFFTAVGHFTYTKGMAMMVPAMIPFKNELIYLTGAMEILLGMGLCVPCIQNYVGWFIIVFFILLMPANIYAALKHVDYQKATYEGSGIAYLWFRIPLQIFFIMWVYLSVIKI